MKKILRLFSVFSMVLPLSSSLVSCSNVLTFYQKEGYIIDSINNLMSKDDKTNFNLSKSDFTKINSIIVNYFQKRQIFSLAYDVNFKRASVKNDINVQGNFNLNKHKHIFNNNIAKVDYNVGFYKPYFNEQKNLLISKYDNLENNLNPPKDFDVVFNADGWSMFKECLVDNDVNEMINFIKNDNFFIKALPNSFNEISTPWWVNFIQNVFNSVSNYLPDYSNINLDYNANAIAIFHFDNYGKKLDFTNLSTLAEKSNYYFSMANIPSDSLFPIAFEDNNSFSNMKTMILNGSLLSLVKNVYDSSFGNKNWKILGIAGLLMDNNFLFSGLTINRVAKELYNLFDEDKITDNQLINNAVSLFEF